MPEISERLSKLLAMLEKSPNDAFLLYGIAMEHKKAGRGEEAIAFLDRTIAADGKYCYAYFQKGQTLEQRGDVENAKAVYRQGITAATIAGDAHAREEIGGALAMLD